MGVVKANAYGHGDIPVARTLLEEGISMLATARVPEALRLREAGIDAPILILGTPFPDYLPTYVRHNLEVTVPSEAVADAVVATARQVGPLRVHVKVDTGMSRLGFSPEQAVAVVRRLDKVPGVTLAGLWTHFATATEYADPFAETQLNRIRPIWESLNDVVERVHLAHSGALFNFPASFQAFDRALVRVGIALYGLIPPPTDTAPAPLRPAMRFTSRIVQVKTIPAGTTVSYGRTWRAPSRTRIATVGAGYGDGYARFLSNRAEVGIHGRRYPVIGTICMDMFMVDLGPPDGHGKPVILGDEVVLFGPGGPSTFEVARWAETIPYEVCCSLTARVPHLYLDEATSGTE